MILLISNERDITTDYIVLELERRDSPTIRMNTEKLPQWDVSFSPTGARGYWRFDSDEVSFYLADIAAVYYRRPGDPIVNLEDADWSSYARHEWAALLKSITSALEGRYLNSPSAIAMAEDKPRQLALATSHEFLIPETAIGNNPSLFRWVMSAGEQCVAKPLRHSLVGHGDRERVLFTSDISAEPPPDDAEIRAAPLIAQRRIEKRSDIRVTVVGERVFAVAIESQGCRETATDWRRGSRTDIPHVQHELPRVWADRCIKMVRELGLRYAAIDLALDRDGRYWFFEVNPNGQWAWIENRTGTPIAAAICDELELIAQWSSDTEIS